MRKFQIRIALPRVILLPLPPFMQYPAYRGFDKLTSDMQWRAQSFLKDAADQGFSVVVTETWRSQERQQYLYSLGRAQPGSIVTWTLQSKHILGEAIDIAFSNKGKITYDGDFEGLARIGEKNGLNWGGRWPTPDKPHFELNHNWQTDHWAYQYQEKLLQAALITVRKNLDEPPSRGELFVMIEKIRNH